MDQLGPTNAHFFVTAMFIKPLKQMICVGQLLWLPKTLTLSFGDQIFSIIMFVILVVDNVVTLVVVTLVGYKIVTVVVDSQNLKS